MGGSSGARMGKKIEKADNSGMTTIDRVLSRIVHFISRAKISADSIRSILVICLEDISSVIQMHPIIQVLKEQLPDTKIDTLVGECARTLLEAHPALRDVLIYNAPWMMHDFHSPELPSSTTILALSWEMRSRGYDVVLCLHPDFRTNLIAGLSGAPIRIGYGTAGGGYFLTQDVPFDSQKAKHQNHFDLLSHLGIRPYYLAPQLSPMARDVVSARAILDGLIASMPLALIHPPGISPKCHWLVEHFRAMIERLSKEGFQVLLIGGNDSGAMLRNIAQDYGLDKLQIWNFPTFGEVVALSKFTQLYLGIDSNVSHIMSASGAPSVILMGHIPPSASPLCGPQTRLVFPAQPCPAKSPPDSTIKETYLCECVKYITVQQVSEACGELLGIESLSSPQNAQ
jgi:heptosyltransferase III